MIFGIPDVLVGYLVGSVITGWLVWKHAVMLGAERCIDRLIDDGYLRHKQHGGDVELIKWNYYEKTEEKSSSQEHE